MQDKIEVLVKLVSFDTDNTPDLNCDVFTKETRFTYPKKWNIIGESLKEDGLYIKVLIDKDKLNNE